MLKCENYLLEVDLDGQKAKSWVLENKSRLLSHLDSIGAIRIRGLNISSSRQFGQLLTELFGSELLSYEYRSTPRTELRGNVYTATEYRADQTIVQHNEQAYTNSWPMKIGFCCMYPSTSGGQTPIADSRVIYQCLNKDIRDKFSRLGVTYVRYYSELDLPWKEVYNTHSKEVVEQFCRDNFIEFTWFGEELMTKQTLPAIQNHPVTKEPLWFNQAHLFHSSSLDAGVREELMSSRGVEKLPRNTFYGDGSVIEDSVIQEINNTYEQHRLIYDWQKGDVMLLDNMLFSHGRMPFSGERQVLVGMTDAYSLM